MATLWGVLLTALAVTDFDVLGPEPVSYLGTRPASAALFTVALGVSALLFIAFHHYVRGRFAVGFGFSVAMLTGMAGQMVAAFVTIGGDGVAHRVHTYSALVLGASLPVLMWRFAAAQARGRWRTLCYGLFWAEAAACAAGLHLSSRSISSLAEILPAVVFHAWVIAVTIRGVVGWSTESQPRASDRRAGDRRGRFAPPTDVEVGAVGERTSYACPRGQA